MKSKSTTTKTKRFKQSKKWIPHKYQKRAKKFVVNREAAALFLDPGLGKTSIVLAAFMKLRRKNKKLKMLVIAPLRVCHQVWPAEVEEWAQFNKLKVVVLHGPRKAQLLQEDADIYVINPEGLPWLIYEDPKAHRFNPKRWTKFGFDILCVDELTMFKNARSARFKNLKIVLPSFKKRWGLTGTPTPNGLLDLFGQMYVLDLGNSLGKFVTHYRTKYFRMLDPNGWKWALQRGAAKRIYKRLKDVALRMAAEDYLDLPKAVHVKHYIELPPKARKLYDEMEDLLLSKYEDQVITAGNGAAASQKCRQICNGAVYVDGDMAAAVEGKKRSVLELHQEKLDAVAELNESLQGGQLLLSYEFNHDIDRLRKHFPKMEFIGKGVSPKQGKILENKWNKGLIQMLGGHPASMGHGGNYQKSNAAHIAMYSMLWDYELWDQFIKRVLRQGNKCDQVFIHHFIAKDTVDEDIYYDKFRKKRGQDNLFDALQARQAKRRKK